MHRVKGAEMAGYNAARHRRALEREARRLIKQWVEERLKDGDPPDLIIRFHAFHKRKAWVAPFDTGNEPALILSNGAIAVKAAMGTSWLPWKQWPVWVVMRPYSDQLRIRDLQVLVASVKEDLASAPIK